MSSYRLLTYNDPSGPRAGLLVHERVYDVARLLDAPAYASVLGILEDWTAAEPRLADLAEDDFQRTRLARQRIADGDADLFFAEIERKQGFFRHGPRRSPA